MMEKPEEDPVKAFFDHNRSGYRSWGFRESGSETASRVISELEGQKRGSLLSQLPRWSFPLAAAAVLVFGLANTLVYSDLRVSLSVISLSESIYGDGGEVSAVPLLEER